MTQDIHTARPALTAIAAALAFTATPALAQQAEPVAPPPLPSASAPAAQAPAVASPLPSVPQIATPTAPPMASTPAPAPVVAPTLPTGLPEAAPQRAERAAPAEAPARDSAERSTPRTTTAERATPATPTRAAEPAAQPRVAAAPAAPVVPADVTPNDAAPAVSPSDMMAAPPPEVVEQAPPPATAQADANSSYWALGAGGAVLILGAAALAMLRRRDRREDAYEETYAPERVTTEPGRATPVAVDEPDPLIAALAVAGTPADEPAHAPVAHAEPPRSSASVRAKRAPVIAGNDERAELEAMVAEAPSAENPFVTRKNRLRRAAFLRQKGVERTEPVTAPEMGQAPAAAAADRKEQPVYSFSGRNSARPRNWKPATT